jgi:chromatin structure-remodeling complex protein RSC7
VLLCWCSVFNSRLCAIRKENLAGLYDIHTNTIQMPAHVQPTRAVFEPVVDDDEGGYDRHDSEGAKNNNINDINNISNINNNTAATTTTPTIFPKPDAKMTRNHLVLDIYHRGPGAGLASAAYEQPYDDSDPLAPFRGLSAVSAEIRALLPPACRAAFDSARVHEIAWRTGWDEARARERDSRRALVIDRTVQPYSIPLGDV